MYILRCMSSESVWNFKGHLWKFTQNIGPIHHKIVILLTFIFVWFTISFNCDVISLSVTGPWRTCHQITSENAAHEWRIRLILNSTHGKTYNISRTKSPNLNVLLFSPCSCLGPIHWSQVLSRELRCSWSSTRELSPCQPFVNGCNMDCHNDRLWWHQWRQWSWYHENSQC